jgi:hypothetical protein
MNEMVPPFETNPGFLAEQFSPRATDSAAFEPLRSSEMPAMQLRSPRHPADQEQP